MATKQVTTVQVRARSKAMWRVWTNPALLVYNAWLVFSLPIVGTLAGIRNLRRGKPWMDTDRWRVALRGAAPSGDGLRMALAGVSYGEFVILRRLADRVRGAIPDAQFTFLIRNPKVLERVLVEAPEHSASIWPSEFIVPVTQMLGQVQPDIVVVSERLRYTNLCVASRLYGAEVVVVNGRTRVRKGIQYALSRAYYRWFFGSISGLFMQSPKFVDAVRPFARPDALIQATGDLKFDLQRRRALPASAAELEGLLSGGDPLFVGGSTADANEERMVGEAFRRVREKHACRLLVAPRNVERRAEVIAVFQAMGFSCSLRSEGASPSDVVVLDTLGELGFVYSLGIGAYVGGAMSGMGHNVLEPVEWGLPVSYGMRRGHFEQAQLFCEEAGIGVRVASADDLAAHWIDVLEREAHWKESGAQAAKLLEGQRGAMDRTVEGILHVLGGGARSRDVG